MEERIQSEFQKLSDHFLELKRQAGVIRQAAEICIQALRAGNKLLFCGNGGSAADAQHLAAELIGRYKKERAPFPAIALTVDSSALTAIANDYGYECVFRRQVEGLGQKGDVLIGLSTSGNSPNVLSAIACAKERGLSTIGLSGITGGKLRELADVAICVPSSVANTIQEMHIAVGHVLCDLIESALCHEKSPVP
jgi:D-sedoheptulose 7-phosphate isomerase